MPLLSFFFSHYIICVLFYQGFTLKKKQKKNRILFYMSLTLWYVSWGSGVMISIKESIFTPVVSSPDHIEAITIKLFTCNQIILSCIYIPPNSKFTMLHTIWLIYWPHSHHLKLLLLAASTCQTSTGSHYVLLLLFLKPFVTFDNNLVQLVHERTHINGNLLDLVLSRSEEIISNLKLSSQKRLVNSDHFAITFNIIYSSTHAKQSSC